MLEQHHFEEFRLSSRTWKHIEEELESYHKTKNRIALRREEILFKHKETDTNIGGGKSNTISDPTGQKGTALGMDIELQHMTQIVDVIEYVYSRLDDEKKQLVQLAYWTKPQTLTPIGIAIKLNVTDRTVRRWKTEIIYAIAALMGWR